MRRRRTELADQAARIFLAGEAVDWQRARAKALKHAELSHPLDQPDAQEIDHAIHERMRIFASPGQRQALRRKRQAAMHAMRLLTAFEPRLSGPVLGGTAVDASPVELHLFADRAEDVSMFLSDQGIAHRSSELTLRLRDGRKQKFPAFLFEAGEDAFELIVFPSVELKRPAPLEPGASRPMLRADSEALRKLIA
jgi:hypothetical protein